MPNPLLDIRIGTMVRANQGDPAAYVKQILPLGFESIQPFFWQTVGDKEEAALILLLPHKFCWCIGRHLCVLYVSKFVERGCRLGGCGVGGAFTKGVSHSVGQSTGVEHE